MKFPRGLVLGLLLHILSLIDVASSYPQDTPPLPPPPPNGAPGVPSPRLVLHFIPPSPNSQFAYGPSNPHFVFVPGAFHTEEHFRLIRWELQILGYNSSVVNRPSIGFKGPAPAPDADWQALTSLLHQLIEVEGKHVIMVAHSAGGVIASRSVGGYDKRTRMANDQAGGIVHLYFISAFLLKDGVTILQRLGIWNRPKFAWINILAGNLYPTSNADSFFFNDMVLDSARTSWQNLLKPMSWVDQSVPKISSYWSLDLPKSYLTTTRDLALPPDMQSQMVRDVSDSTWTIDTLNAGHDPFISSVPETTGFLLQAAARSKQHFNL